MKLTKISDYYEQLYKQFPDVPKQDIKRILNFGFRSLYLHNSYGGDTFIKNNDFWCYIGNVSNDPIKHFSYYLRRLIIRLRVLYRRRHIPWDGYYYFAISEEAYQNYLKQNKKRGRKKKIFNYGKVNMCLMKDECKLRAFKGKYIFRVPYIAKIGFQIVINEFISDKAEFVETMDAPNFKNVLTYCNKYELL